MDKVFFDAGRSVVVDWCASGHGLWFDRGELGRVLEQLARLKNEPLGELASFLGETFRK
jgi:Zn-finger nucleic acid-binding protein